MSNDIVIRIEDDFGNVEKEYRFDPRKFINPEAIAVEKAFRLTWPQVMTGLNTGLASAITAIVWLLEKRKDPKIKPSDIVFNMGMAEVLDPDTDERYDAKPDDLDQVLAEAEAEWDGRVDGDEGPEDEPEVPKDSPVSPTPDPAT